jgi:hypothetical protein
MNPTKIPPFNDWLLGQTHRDDLVGSLAKLSLSSKSEEIDRWLREQEDGIIMKPAVDNARAEYAQCVHELQTVGHSESFPIMLRAISEEAMAASWARHRAAPTKTPEKYLHELHKALRKEVESVRRLYLDTNHWIRLLNVILGRSRPADSPYATLLSMLRELRGRNQLICPCSYPLFHELLKQTDPNTRRRMAALIDELSGGVCIQPPNQLERIELKRQILRAVLGSGAPDVGEWVWVKVSAVVGEIFPVPLSKSLPRADVVAVRKVMIDQMWNTPLAALAEFPLPEAQDPLEPLAQAYVKDAEDYRKRGVPFDRVLMEQKAIYFEQLRKNDFARIAKEVEEQFPDECAAIASRGDDCQSYDPNILASIQIKAAVFASFIVSTQTKQIVVNDVVDAVHASVSLPYVDAACLDRGMAHRLSSPPLRFGHVYRAKIFSSPDELLAWLTKNFSRH